MERLIKIVLAILFFLCLLAMPYGFYQLVRFAALIGFVVLAYQANESSKKAEMVIYVALAILFQPFFKIALGREFWNVINVVVAIGLLSSVIIGIRKPKM